MRRLLRSLLIVALFVPIVPRIVAAQNTPPDTPLDLAAMMLTPADLDEAGLEGYGLHSGVTVRKDFESTGSASSDSAFSEKLASMYEEAGYRYSRLVQIDLPSRENPDWAARRVWMVVDEFDPDADLTGIVNAVFESGGADQVRATRTIGDESEIVRVRYQNDDDAKSPVESLVLGFQVGGIIGFLGVADFENFAPDLTPTVEEVETLGTRFAGRIEDVEQSGGPGVASRVLRFRADGETVRSVQDYYERLDGESLALYGESSDDTNARDAESDKFGMIDLYAVSQDVGPSAQASLSMSIRPRTFRTADLASAWLQRMPRLVGEIENFTGQSDAKSLSGTGDEALTFSYVSDVADPDSADWHWLITVVRIGKTVSVVQLGRPGDLPPRDVFDSLVEMQVECMEQTCVSEVAAPPALLALAEGDSAGRNASPSERNKP